MPYRALNTDEGAPQVNTLEHDFYPIIPKPLLLRVGDGQLPIRVDMLPRSDCKSRLSLSLLLLL